VSKYLRHSPFSYSTRVGLQIINSLYDKSNTTMVLVCFEIVLGIMFFETTLSFSSLMNVYNLAFVTIKTFQKNSTGNRAGTKMLSKKYFLYEYFPSHNHTQSQNMLHYCHTEYPPWRLEIFFSFGC